MMVDVAICLLIVDNGRLFMGARSGDGRKTDEERKVMSRSVSSSCCCVLACLLLCVIVMRGKCESLCVAS